METKTKEYLGKFALVFGTVIGLGAGYVFMWMGLVEKQSFTWFIIGFIMVIIGLFSFVLLFSDK